MSETMVSYDEKTNVTISINPEMLVTKAITIVPLASANLVAGTTLAESSITISGSTIAIHRAAENGDTRTGILMTDVASYADVSTPPIQADLVGGVMAIHGVFKSANITDETVKGTIQSETLANTNLFFK